MRGETTIHVFVMLVLGLLGLQIYVDYGGYILVLGDVVSINIIIFMSVFLTSHFFHTQREITFFDYESSDYKSCKVYVEDDLLNINMFRICFVILAASLISRVWELSILVDSVFIYILTVWGYALIVIALVIIDFYLYFERVKEPENIEEKG